MVTKPQYPSFHGLVHPIKTCAQCFSLCQVPPLMPGTGSYLLISYTISKPLIQSNLSSRYPLVGYLHIHFKHSFSLSSLIMETAENFLLAPSFQIRWFFQSLDNEIWKKVYYEALGNPGLPSEKIILAAFSHHKWSLSSNCLQGTIK